MLVGGVSLGSQYVAARYMGAESPAIIGSILSIIVIVAYGKLTASKEEKARKSTLKGLEVLNAWSIYLLILFLIVLTSPLFPGLRTTLENNWVTRISLPINDSTMNYTVSWLTHAGVLLFVGTFVGGLIQGAKIWELFAVLWNTVKQLKENFYHGNLSGEFVHYHGYGRYDFSYSHCFGSCYRKSLSVVCPCYRLPGYLYYGQ